MTIVGGQGAGDTEVLGDEVLLPDPDRYPIDIVDLQAALPSPYDIITDSTSPTTDQVKALIFMVSDEINGKLRSKGYALPLDSSLTGALSFLNTVHTFGALAEFWRLKYPAQDGPGGQHGVVDFYETKYQALLKDILSGALGVADDPRPHVVGSGFDHDRPIARRGMIF